MVALLLLRIGLEALWAAQLAFFFPKD